MLKLFRRLFTPWGGAVGMSIGWGSPGVDCYNTAYGGDPFWCEAFTVFHLFAMAFIFACLLGYLSAVSPFIPPSPPALAHKRPVFPHLICMVPLTHWPASIKCLCGRKCYCNAAWGRIFTKCYVAVWNLVGNKIINNAI